MFCFQDTITLEKLDLRGNWIEGEGGEAVARMLEENDYVTDVVSILKNPLKFKFLFLTKSLLVHTDTWLHLCL